MKPENLILILIPILCIGLLPSSQALTPAPDGGYPGGNTAEGQNALLSRTTGGYNTAVGYFSLLSDTTNSFNTAVGAGTLLANTADQNTAIGAGALLNNITGSDNTANGAFALFSNIGGIANTATGFNALFNNTTGNGNTAIGSLALGGNTTGHDNTAIGSQALPSNSTGLDNTATGAGTLLENTTGHDNTAIGFEALELNSTGNNNIALGARAGVNINGSDNIVIGNPGVSGESNVIRIGGDNQFQTVIAAIYGVNESGNSRLPVYINEFGQLGTTASSQRFKDEIKPMEKASEALLRLKPVTFHYKGDKQATPQFGLVAEDVADVNPDLIVRDKKGEIYSVRYDAVNAMLLNEFLKEHRKVEQQDHHIQEQDAIIAQLKSGMATLAATVKEQAAQVQKVSAQLELIKTAPQTVLNNR
jgi:trimeric autotransporter adhesin